MSLAGKQRWVGPRSAAVTPSAEAVALPAPVRPLSLRINFSWILAGNLVRALSRYGMLLLLIHSCGLAAAGRYALAIALCNPIWAFVMLGLRGAQITDAKQEYAFADYLAVRLLASAAGLIVVAAVVLCGAHSAEMVVVILLIAFARLIEGVSDIFRGQLQRQERMDRIAVALFIQGLGGVTMMAIAGGLGASAMLMVATVPAAMILTLLFWDLPCYAQFAGQERHDKQLWRQPLHWHTLGQLSVVSFPLAVVGFLIALIPQLPKYYIGAILSEEAVAIYTMIGYWISLGLMVVAAMGNAAAPRMSKYHAAGKSRAFVRLLARLVAIVGGMGVVGILIVATSAPRLAGYLGHESSDLPQLAVALSIFAAMLYITAPLGRALSAMRRFWWQTSAIALGILVAAAVLPWAVRSRGMVGAAEAMAFSMAIVVLVSAGLVWRELSPRFRRDDHPQTEAA